jgi:hypothetical protein
VKGIVQGKNTRKQRSEQECRSMSLSLGNQRRNAELMGPLKDIKYAVSGIA